MVGSKSTMIEWLDEEVRDSHIVFGHPFFTFACLHFYVTSLVKDCNIRKVLWVG
jgi:hypothetical protein